jgi:hypothetical protein
MGLTIPPCKTWICLETSTEALEEEEGWGGHGPKTGRSATEEEEAGYVLDELGWEVLPHYSYIQIYPCMIFMCLDNLRSMWEAHGSTPMKKL